MRIVFPFILWSVVLSASFAEPLSWLQTAADRFKRAAREYDGDELTAVAAAINGNIENVNGAPEALLLLGLVYWRLELIAFCNGSASETKKYGKLALQTLQKAESAGADIYLAASHRALAAQLIASLGMSSGARYGPRAAQELEKARTARPRGYFTQLVEAINAYQAPSFAGGAPEKAVALFRKMEQRFPDSIDVKIHLAQALHKNGNTGEAAALILPIAASSPSNLLAKKTESLVTTKR